MLSIRELISDILVDYSLEVMDVFEYGSKKIEFMVKCNNVIISISMVDDMSYDYMVFDGNGERILYSNTERLTSMSQLNELLKCDLNTTVNKYAQGH